MVMTVQRATNVLRETGAVVPVEQYQAVCAERDEARAEITRLTALVAERTPMIVTSGDLTINLLTGALSRNGETFDYLTRVERMVIKRLAFATVLIFGAGVYVGFTANVDAWYLTMRSAGL